MGIGSFFKNIGSSIKTGFQRGVPKVISTLKNVGNLGLRGVSFIGKHSKPILNILKNVPGTIGDVSNLLDKGISKVNEYVDMLPQGTVKDKLKELSGSASGIKDNIKNKLEDTSKAVINKSQPWIESASNITNRLNS